VADGTTRRRVSPKQVIVGILVVVVVILAIANSHKVKVDFVVDHFRIPLFLVIAGSAIIGWVVGWFTGRGRESR